MKNILPLLCAAAMMAVASISHAGSSESDVPHISVSGTAKIEVAPDILHWTVLVSTTGGNTEDVAQRQDASASTALGTIREIGIKSEDIQTSFTQLAENWVYRNQSHVMDGYKASTMITFRCLNLDLYRKLWLSLAKIPGVSIRSADWDTSKRILLQGEARATALKSAKEKADTMATTAGVSLLEPISITEVQDETGLLYRANAAPAWGVRPDGSEDSSSPGTIEVSARVEMSFRIGKK